MKTLEDIEHDISHEKKTAGYFPFYWFVLKRDPSPINPEQPGAFFFHCSHGFNRSQNVLQNPLKDSISAQTAPPEVLPAGTARCQLVRTEFLGIP